MRSANELDKLCGSGVKDEARSEVSHCGER